MNKLNLKIIQTLFIVVMLLCGSVMVSAQIDMSNPNGRPSKEPPPQMILETLAKKKIEDEKKDHEKLLERGEEAVQLSEELDKSFTANKKLSSQDKKKLKSLEKILKKIRSDLGGDDDDEEFEEKPANTGDAIKSLNENTVNLVDEIKRTSRHTVSVIAIQSSNVVLKIVKFLRFGF